MGCAKLSSAGAGAKSLDEDFPDIDILSVHAEDLYGYPIFIPIPDQIQIPSV